MTDILIYISIALFTVSICVPIMSRKMNKDFAYIEAIKSENTNSEYTCVCKDGIPTGLFWYGEDSNGKQITTYGEIIVDVLSSGSSIVFAGMPALSLVVSPTEMTKIVYIINQTHFELMIPQKHTIYPDAAVNLDGFPFSMDIYPHTSLSPKVPW